jgi:PAS domain-containing protein
MNKESNDSAVPEAELLRLLAENVKDDAIFVVDTEGLVRSWNPGAQRLLGDWPYHAALGHRAQKGTSLLPVQDARAVKPR